MITKRYGKITVVRGGFSPEAPNVEDVYIVKEIVINDTVLTFVRLPLHELNERSTYVDKTIEQIMTSMNRNGVISVTLTIPLSETVITE